MQRDSILFVSAAAVMANTLAFALTFDSVNYQSNNLESYQSVISNEHAYSQRVIFGIFVALAGQMAFDNAGKMFLNRQSGDTITAQLVLQLSMLVPSSAYLIGVPNINFAAFYWTLLHLQIILTVHVALCVWMYRLGDNVAVIDVYSNSVFNVMTFSLHIYLSHPAWSMAHSGALLVVYRLFFCFSCLSMCAMLGRGMFTLSALKRPSTVEERWAMLAGVAVLVFYIGFVSIELGYLSSYAEKLNTNFIVANNYWLAIFAFVLNAIIERKDRREGVLSEVSLVNSHCCCCVTHTRNNNLHWFCFDCYSCNCKSNDCLFGTCHTRSEHLSTRPCWDSIS